MDDNLRARLKEMHEMKCKICHKPASWKGGVEQRRFNELYIRENGFCSDCDTENNTELCQEILEKTVAT